MEESNLLHLDHYERRSCSQDIEEGCSNSEDTNLLEVGDSLEIDIEDRDSLEIDVEAKHLQLSLPRFILYHANIENRVTSEVKLPAWNKVYMVAKPTKTLKSKNEDPGNP